MKDEMIRKIYGQVIKWDKSVKKPELFYNLEGDWAISYKQGGKKFLIMIEEID